MKILVCVKQILKRGDRTCREEAVMNRFDEFAVEEAVRIRDRLADSGLPSTLDVITVGQADAISVLKRAMGMGADNGLHILSSDPEPVPAIVTASYLKAAAAPRGYDLILAGLMAEDTLDGQVGPMLAALLGIPSVTAVMHTHIPDDASRILVEQEMEEGMRNALEIRLPVLVTVQAGINVPRYPALSKILAAQKKPIERIDVKSVATGIPGSGIVQTALEEPLRTRQSLTLQGSCQEKATAVIRLFRERGLL